MVEGNRTPYRKIYSHYKRQGLIDKCSIRKLKKSWVKPTIKYGSTVKRMESFPSLKNLIKN